MKKHFEDFQEDLSDDLPDLAPGELRCSACLRASSKKAGWMSFNFRALAPAHLCPQCWPAYSHHVAALQEKGI